MYLTLFLKSEGSISGQMLLKWLVESLQENNIKDSDGLKVLAVKCANLLLKVGVIRHIECENSDTNFKVI